MTVRRSASLQTRRNAFSLVELVLSLALMTLLMGALGSAMVIAGRALPDRKNALSATVDAADVVDQIAGELYTTKTVTARSDKMVEFQLADRNGDGIDDIVRYEWSGTAGASLTRTYNSLPAVVVLEDVREFNLNFDLVAIASATPPVGESAEVVLLHQSATKGLSDFAVDKSNWIGQYFIPSLPPDATAWKITRVRLFARSNGANNGISRIQWQAADASGLPTGAPIDSDEMIESTLNKEYTEQEFRFANVKGLTPGTGLCLVVQWLKDAHSCEIQYINGGASFTGTNAVSTANGGAVWNSMPTKSLMLTVYGAYSSPTASQTPLKYITGVRIRLRTGSGAASLVETKARLLNEPEAF